MSTEGLAETHIQIHVENIGGIEETDIEASSGVITLAGRNATNRTSLLYAIMAALGSDTLSLKGDADHGEVKLTIGDTTYTRTLIRQNGTITAKGDPYLDDATVADLFAFLLESNEARRAVTQGRNLRDLIMRPIDTDAINTEIGRLEDKRRQIDDRLNELETLERDLPDLEAERKQLTSQIENKRNELEAKEAEIDAADRDVDETREQKSVLEDTLDDLQETRTKLDNDRYDIDTQEESLIALQNERIDLEDELESLPDTPAGERTDLDSRIEQLRAREDELETEIAELQSIIQFNEDMLDGDDMGYLNTLTNEPETTTEAALDGSITDQLLANETVTCWTCGTEVDPGQVEATLDRLRTLREEAFADVNEVREDLDELESDRDTLENQQYERERIDRRLTQIDDEINERESTLKELKANRETLTDKIEQLETEVDQLENDEYTEVLDLHKEANQLEFELDRLENDRDDIDQEIAEIEEHLEERDQLQDQRAETQSELEDLRTRIGRIEAEAIEEFNQHMETVLNLLNYKNIERIWLERTEQTVREGRQNVDKSIFELHVVRTTRSGTAYEDTIDHLSESEREVTGLVFALAGYLVHDLYETVPVMLLDSLEALDSNRIATLVDYFQEYTDYLFVALLPEDAAALNENHQRVTDI